MLRPLDFLDERLLDDLRDLEVPRELPPRRDFAALFDLEPPLERELDRPPLRDPPRLADRLEPRPLPLVLREPPDLRLERELPPRDLAEREPPDFFDLLDLREDELLRDELDFLLEPLELPLDLEDPLLELLPPREEAPPPPPRVEPCPIRCAATAPRTPPTTAPIGPATLPITAPVAAPAAGFGI